MIAKSPLQLGLPEMVMGIDETWHDDFILTIDDVNRLINRNS